VALATSRVPSVEQSSAISISQLAYVCTQTEAMVWPMVFEAR
jgi:hypothetical protein